MKKSLRKILYRIFILFNQKIYHIENGKKIKYLFFPKKSDELIISFSGFAGENKKPKYNYIKTLKGVEKNQIYILDDFGYKKSGSYYLGENGDYFLEREIPRLVNKIKHKYNIKKVYTIGTSKGGWACLYYGILLGCDVVICGAPQYYIGNYLNTTCYHKKILKSITRNQEKWEIKDLNYKLRNAIKEFDISNIKFIIHYSKNEHTYKDHICYLLKDLKSENAYIEEDISNYLSHHEVGIYFKKVLLKVFNKKIL